MCYLAVTSDYSPFVHSGVMSSWLQLLHLTRVTTVDYSWLQLLHLTTVTTVATFDYSYYSYYSWLQLLQLTTVTTVHYIYYSLLHLLQLTTVDYSYYSWLHLLQLLQLHVTQRMYSRPRLWLSLCEIVRVACCGTWRQRPTKQFCSTPFLLPSWRHIVSSFISGEGCVR